MADQNEKQRSNLKSLFNIISTVNECNTQVIDIPSDNDKDRNQELLITTTNESNRNINNMGETNKQDNTGSTKDSDEPVRMRRSKIKLVRSSTSFDILHESQRDLSINLSQIQIIQTGTTTSSEALNDFLNMITNEVTETNKSNIPKDPLTKPALGSAGMYPTNNWLTELQSRGIRRPLPGKHYNKYYKIRNNKTKDTPINNRGTTKKSQYEKNNNQRPFPVANLQYNDDSFNLIHKSHSTPNVKPSLNIGNPNIELKPDSNLSNSTSNIPKQ